MKTLKQRHAVKIFIMLLCMPLMLGWGNQLVKKTKLGNQLYNQGNLEGALEAYREAQVESPDAPELHFNIGNAMFKEKKYEEAMNEYKMTIENTTEANVESQAYYNIGVAQFRLAELDESMGKIQEALEKLEQSMESNRQAMRLNPDDEDPKYNFEQAKRKWKELYSRYKQEQPPPEGQKQEQQQQKEQEKEAQAEQQQAEQKEEQTQPENQESQEQQEAQQMAKAEDKKEKQEMTEEDAMRILNSLEEEDAKAMKRVMPFQYGSEFKMEKDW